MGCWNGTCALTHLPIMHGEKVRGYILVPANFRYDPDNVGLDGVLLNGGYCYTTGVFHPLSIAIRGVYNDYGSIEHIKKSPNNKAILEYVNKLIERKDVEIFPDAFGDDAKKPVLRVGDIKELIHLIERGNTPFGFCMMLESAVKAASAAMDTNKGYGSTRAYSTSLRAELDLWRNHRAATKGSDMAELLGRYNIPKLEGTHWNSAAECFGNSSNPTIDPNFSSEHIGNMVDVADDKLLTEMVEHIQLDWMMGLTRRGWMPQTGAGSQGDEYNLHRKLAEFTLDHVEKKKQECIKDTNVDDYPEELTTINESF